MYFEMLGLFVGCIERCIICFAGSWHSQGHSSSLGLSLVIDAHTALVVDYLVLSKRCATCCDMKTKFTKKKIDQVKYDAWKCKHNEVCNLNYEGSSGAMEETAAKILWQRSEDSQLRYTTFIGDGDCSAYSAVCALSEGEGPYGLEKPITKEECVNQQLTDENLLKRYLKGKTQNPKESLHSRIWKLRPKVKSLAKETLELVVAQAVINYNVGYKACFLWHELGITNDRILKYVEEMDRTREQEIQQRPRKKRKKLEVEDQYAAGEF